MKNLKENIHEMIFPLVIIISTLTLYLTSFESFLFFHTLAELFTAVIAFGVFVVAWTSRRYINNNFLLITGVGYLFVGALDLVHILSYKGLGIFPDDANLPTQFWVAARSMESLSFIAAFLFLKKKKERVDSELKRKGYRIFLIYFAVFVLLVLSILYWKIFPDAYHEGLGLTTFKKVSEYVISALFILSIVLLLKNKKVFGREITNLLSLALMVKIFSEISFTEYVGVYDFSNTLGHLFKFISFLLIYRAFLEIGLMRPYDFLFHDLKKSETKSRIIANNTYDFESWIDPDGQYIYASPSSQRITGYPPSEFMDDPKLRLKIVHPEDRKKFEDHVKDRNNKRDIDELEYRIIKKDGTIRWIGHACLPVFSGNKFLGVRISDRDITDRKQIEHDLAKTQERLRKKIEEQLMDSYKHLGIINRKISLLLEMRKRSDDKRDIQEIANYILSSAIKLSRAQVGYLYKFEKNILFLVSAINNNSNENLEKISFSEAEFTKRLLQEKNRISGPCDIVDPGCFNKNELLSYFAAFPLVEKNKASGFIFLGFSGIKSMDSQELEFLDVFAMQASSALHNARILK